MMGKIRPIYVLYRCNHPECSNEYIGEKGGEVPKGDTYLNGHTCNPQFVKELY